ncbi:MAG: hypothetical protein V1748_08665 [Actinomycetota bacterium]
MFLLQEAFGLHRDGMGYSVQYRPERDGRVKVSCTLYVGNPEKFPDVRAETTCMWGDASRDPAKEVLLRCAVKLLEVTSV